MDSSSYEQMIINLEIKLTHQERVIEELNEALFSQQQRLDGFEKVLTDLKKILQAGEQDIRPNEKPPHY